MPRVITLLHGLDDTRAQAIRLDPDTLVMYTRAIKVAAQQIGLPVMVKTLSDRMAIALETDDERSRHIRLNALRSRRARDGPVEARAAVPCTALQTLKCQATDARPGDRRAPPDLIRQTLMAGFLHTRWRQKPHGSPGHGPLEGQPWCHRRTIRATVLSALSVVEPDRFV